MVRSERKGNRQLQTSTKSDTTTKCSVKTALRYLKMVASSVEIMLRDPMEVECKPSSKHLAAGEIKTRMTY